MKITMMMVSSLNGKITKGNDPNIYNWTSIEDQNIFHSTLGKNNLIVMGRKTYEAAKRYIIPDKHKLRIVLTRTPDKYKKESVKKQIEFSSEAPKELIFRLEKLGYTNALLLGGGNVNSLFLKEKLVDEILVTIEPNIFGSGRPLVVEFQGSIELQLTSIKKLNKKGTLLACYKALCNPRGYKE